MGIQIKEGCNLILGCQLIIFSIHRATDYNSNDVVFKYKGEQYSKNQYFFPETKQQVIFWGNLDFRGDWFVKNLGEEGLGEFF